VHQLRVMLVNRYFGLCINIAGIIAKAGELGTRGVGSCGVVRSTLDSKSLFIQILLMIQAPSNYGRLSGHTGVNNLTRLHNFVVP
jgi:hypothetical protein